MRYTRPSTTGMRRTSISMCKLSISSHRQTDNQTRRVRQLLLPLEGAVGYFWLHCGMQANGFQLLLRDDASKFETVAKRKKSAITGGFREISEHVTSKPNDTGFRWHFPVLAILTTDRFVFRMLRPPNSRVFYQSSQLCSPHKFPNGDNHVPFRFRGEPVQYPYPSSVQRLPVYLYCSSVYFNHLGTSTFI